MKGLILVVMILLFSSCELVRITYDDLYEVKEFQSEVGGDKIKVEFEKGSNKVNSISYFQAGIKVKEFNVDSYSLRVKEQVVCDSSYSYVFEINHNNVSFNSKYKNERSLSFTLNRQRLTSIYLGNKDVYIKVRRNGQERKCYFLLE